MKPGNLSNNDIKRIFIKIKPYFNKNLGRYTHKKSSDQWYYRSLAFSSSELGYAFGFNIGFFNSLVKKAFCDTGMNITVRGSGENPEKRKKIQDFFREYTKNWTYQDEYLYDNPDRNGSGIILPRYKPIMQFTDQEDILSFLKESIDRLQQLYPKIASNHELFKGLVRAAPFWGEGIISYCRDRSKHL